MRGQVLDFEYFDEPLLKWRAVAFDWSHDLAPPRVRAPAAICGWAGVKVHRVASRDLDDDTAHTWCGLVLRQAGDLLRCTPHLSAPVPCLNCHREERESL